MSADTALFVQKRKDGKFAVQHGKMSSTELPDPEKAVLDDVYPTLGEAIIKRTREAHETEYGFRFFIEDDDLTGIEPS